MRTNLILMLNIYLRYFRYCLADILALLVVSLALRICIKDHRQENIFCGGYCPGKCFCIEQRSRIGCYYLHREGAEAARPGRNRAAD